MRKTTIERKCICDFCGKEMYTDQKTGEPYCGANVRITLKRFFGLIKTETGDIDLCKECYCKLTGKTEEEVGW